MKINEKQKNLSLYHKCRRPGDMAMKALIYLSVTITVGFLLILLFFVLSNGLPAIIQNPDFLWTEYNLSAKLTGILPMVINTVYLIVITLFIAVPIGIASAIYLTQYAHQGKLVRAIRFTTETLAGIPSVIFGVFGYAVFVNAFNLKNSILAACLTLVFCVLPTIVRSTEEALIAVPSGYKEGALAMGASKLKVILGIILPCAMPGILSAVILSMGRIIGETAILKFVLSMNGYGMPDNVFGHITQNGVGVTLSLHLFNSASQGYAGESWIPYATATILLVLIFILNRLANVAAKKLRKG